MFGPIGGPELILILVLALLLFGPRKLPQIGRTLGKALAEFRSVTTEFKTTLDREVALDDLKKTRDDLQSAATEVQGAVRAAARGTVAEGASTPETPVPPGAETVAKAARENDNEPPKPAGPDGGPTDNS